MESFFYTLKVELIFGGTYFTRRQSERDIFGYIEIYYNRYRLHSVLGYKTPGNYEKRILVA